MNPQNKHDKTQLEQAYENIMRRYVLGEEESEGDTLDKGLEIKDKVKELEDAGEEVDPQLKQAADQVEDEVSDTVKDLKDTTG